MRPYLTFSAALHAVLILAILSVVSARSSQPQQVYRIDFVGATSSILNREKEKEGQAPAAEPAKAPPAAARRPPPQKDADAFNLKKVRRPLPRPSLLEDYDLNKPADKPAAPSPSPAAAPSAKPAQAPAQSAAAPGGTGTAEAGAGPGPTVSADMPNFPYPWYLTSLRSSLWDKWAPRMRQLSGECEVVFTIMRDGSVVDLNIETSSGDDGFDYAAVSSVREAAPFPPLPRDFGETFLKVHVQFKSQ